ncbi:MAG: hypothetical protein C0457_11955 [Polymorphum sp.]|nr:hypothetical protein [Polymorphum sp.]
MKTLSIIFEYKSLDVKKLNEFFFNWIRRENLLEDYYNIDGGVVQSADVEAYIFSNSQLRFRVNSNNFETRSGEIANHKISFLDISTEIKLDWLDLILSLSVSGDLLFAYVSDKNYDYWQNAKDPAQYKNAGRPLPDLPLKSNGLPFPLEQQIFDTSQNPGRFVHREGYIEAIGSPMWFSDKFWAMLGKQGPSFPVPGVEVRKLGGLTVLDAGSEGFDEHSSVEIQNLLRQSIYG